ncbi:MAG: tyrosine-protein phosphatase [Chthoniobacter sp.]|nr:tyrosine-protein phosphatase [Chthoniobacter sp.]
MLRLLLVVVLGTCVTVRASARDAAWAVKVERPGLPNLHRVTPNLYRCAQPTEGGAEAAEKLGIKTVISLRAWHSDGDALRGSTLRVERIRFNTWHPEDEDVVRFLRLATDRRLGPFLVHCQHGADRTGTMIAIYRIVVQGWKKEAAIHEMTEGGYGYHVVWKNLVRYLEALDVADLEKKAGLTPSHR